MPQFDPELVQLMRAVLEDAMSRVPLEIAGSTKQDQRCERVWTLERGLLTVRKPVGRISQSRENSLNREGAKRCINIPLAPGRPGSPVSCSSLASL
jgi:hypothetical protein